MKKRMINSLLDTVSWICGVLGFRGIYCLAWCLGWLWFDVLRIRRRVILNGLDIVYGERLSLSQKHSIGRESVRTLLRTVLEFFGADLLLKKAQIKFINKEFIDHVMAFNKGLYILCIHMGNWELLCAACAAYYNVPISVAVKPVGKGYVAQWVENRRKAIGYHLIDRKGPVMATTQIFEALDKKHIVGVIVDQRRPGGQRLPFFGKSASTNNSLVRLWLKKEAPILPVAIRRTGMGQFSIISYPPTEIDKEALKSLSHQEKVTLMTIQMNQCVEKMILENPTEYFWMHNRWKS